MNGDLKKKIEATVKLHGFIQKCLYSCDPWRHEYKRRLGMCEAQLRDGLRHYKAERETEGERCIADAMKALNPGED